MTKPCPIHPFLFALFPVLFLFSHNVHEVRFLHIVAPTLVILGATVGLFLLVKVIVKDYQKSALVLSFFVFFCFSCSHVRQALRACGWSPIGGFRWFRYTLVAFVLLLAAAVYILRKTRKDVRNVTRILNVFGACLVLIPLSNITIYKLKSRGTWERATRSLDIPVKPTHSQPRGPLRDIYYIIPDKYAGADTLREFFAFDNTEFLNYLSNKGFYVASKSQSNYMVTPLSLASSLHMEYINDLRDVMGKGSTDAAPVNRMLQDYPVWRFLKSRGYKFINIGPDWSPTRRNKYADRNIHYGLSPFSMELFVSTILHPFARKIGIPPFEGHRRTAWRRVPYQFEKVAQIAEMKAPTFVLAHILIPHGPHVFDPNGNFLYEEKQKNRGEREKYMDQLVFANKKLKELIDKLLSTSEVEPIIVLQSDEGPYPPDQPDRWTEMSTEQLGHRFRILNAYYLPGVDRSMLYPSISPVNTFRVIFNLYFDADLELLRDESYAIEDQLHLYTFSRVTDKLRTLRLNSAAACPIELGKSSGSAPRRIGRGESQ